MVGLYKFIVTPLGEKFNTIKMINDRPFYLTASVENAKDVNRMAVVVSVPSIYNGDIKEGDIVVIHHNVFRDYYNSKGKIQNSPDYLRDDLFLIEEQRIYLYKREGKEWTANGDYCFVEPYTKLDKFSNTYKEVELKGNIKYSNVLDEGTTIGFLPESEYAFEIDDKILYRMTTNDICLIE